MSLTVNNTPIDDETLDAEFANIKSYFESLGNVSCCERDGEFRQYAKDNMIARVLLGEEANRRGPVISQDEVEAELAKFKAESRSQAIFYPEDDQAELDMIRQQIESNLRVKKMLEDLCANYEPTEEELTRHYEQHRAAFTAPEQVRASHISKNQGRGDSQKAAYDALRDVRKQLVAGADFDEMARLHSDKGREEIDVGFFSRGQMPEEFELVVFSMNVGEVSPVFASTYGYHIAKVTDSKPASLKPLDEVRDEVRRRCIEEHRQRETRNLVQTLQATAKIEDTDPANATAAPQHEHVTA